MDQPARKVSFGINDKYGRECGARYAIETRDYGLYVKFSLLRDGHDYQASQDFTCDSETLNEVIAKADAKIEAYRKRCQKQFEMGFAA